MSKTGKRKINEINYNKFIWEKGNCDAPKPGGLLTTRQPAEYKWMSGYPSHFRKLGRVSFVRGALPKYNTCINLSQTVQYIIT